MVAMREEKLMEPGPHSVSRLEKSSRLKIGKNGGRYPVASDWRWAGSATGLFLELTV